MSEHPFALVQIQPPQLEPNGEKTVQAHAILKAEALVFSRANCATRAARRYNAERRLRAGLEVRLQAQEAELQATRTRLAQVTAECQQIRRQTTRAREEDRARIARELHDVLGSELTGLKLQAAGVFRVLARSAPAAHQEVRSRFEDMLAGFDGAMASVRHIALALRPAVLDAFGLSAAVEGYFRDFLASTGLSGALDSPGDELLLPDETATACFRIFQEALTNIARHARASHVDVRLDRAEGCVVLEVVDDGCGMACDPSARGLGLAGMCERANLLGGSVSITSHADHGTAILVRLPLAPQADTLSAAGGAAEQAGILLSPEPLNAQVAEPWVIVVIEEQDPEWEI